MMRRGMSELFIAGFSAEIIYSFVIIVCSLMIYFGTREIYRLSQHKGIKYFRTAFLFFAFAYFSRSFIKFLMINFDYRTLFDIPPRILNPMLTQTTLFIFIYFSTMAIFYLLSSVIYKKWKIDSKKILFAHLIALIIAVWGVFSKDAFSYMGLNLLLFVLILIIVFISYKSKNKRKKHNFYIIYLLLLFFWLLNIIDILVPTVLRTYQLIIYLFSSGIFLLILYKVLRKVGS